MNYFLAKYNGKAGAAQVRRMTVVVMMRLVMMMRLVTMGPITIHTVMLMTINLPVGLPRHHGTDELLPGEL
jgi:hypothetical protein